MWLIILRETAKEKKSTAVSPCRLRAHGNVATLAAASE